MRIITGRGRIRLVFAGVLTVTAGLTAIFMVPASATPAAQSGPGHSANSDPLAPPPQMSSLYPMVGSYKCDDHPSPGVSPSTLYETNTKGLGGHQLVSSVQIRPNVLSGQAVFGWDPVDGRYFGFYDDNWGSSYTETSPGWVNGHLIFTGTIIQVEAPSATGHASGIDLGLENDYQILGPGHFTDSQTITVPGGKSVQHNYDCHRQ
jgi:hypothetical protein